MSLLNDDNRAVSFSGLPIVTTDDLPEDGWVTVRKTTLTRARKMDEPFLAYTIDGNLAQGQAGDYLMVDGQNYPYPCHYEEFANSYEVVEDAQGQGS
jgi:hypothetical protein